MLLKGKILGHEIGLIQSNLYTPKLMQFKKVPLLLVKLPV